MRILAILFALSVFLTSFECFGGAWNSINECSPSPNLSPMGRGNNVTPQMGRGNNVVPQQAAGNYQVEPSLDKLDTPQFQGGSKIGLRLKGRWRSAMAEGDLGAEVRVVVGLSQRTDDRLLKELKKAGLKVGSTFDTVVTGSVEIGGLPYLVVLPEVKSVDVGKRVQLK